MTNRKPLPVEQSLRPLKCEIPAQIFDLGSEHGQQPVGAQDGGQVDVPGEASQPEERGAGEEEGEAKEEEEKEKIEDDEVRVPRVGRRPELPTKAEIAEHFPLHLKYRSWCAHCRAGRARLAPHISEPQDRERIGITVNADFAFMGSEEAEEDMQPSLVIYDDHASAFWALGVRNKTVTEQVVKSSRISWTSRATRARRSR